MAIPITEIRMEAMRAKEPSHKCSDDSLYEIKIE